MCKEQKRKSSCEIGINHEETIRTVDHGVGGKAVEVGKIVINMCLERNIFINTLKLEQLLILMQLECIKRSGKLLFPENFLLTSRGIFLIERVDKFFLIYAERCFEKQEQNILLLIKEQESVEYVLEKYGHMDAYDLSKLDVFSQLKEKAIPITTMIVPKEALLS